MSNIRPQYLSEYIGQDKIVNNLRVYIDASIKRNEILDHCLFYGPPGLGKTSLALIIANELHTNIKEISAPSIDKVGDLVAILSNLSPGDVLFIDEIHRLKRELEEILYAAMEDYKVNIIIGHEQEARQLTLDLNPFVLVGATTKISMISKPLKERFSIIFSLDYYSNENLAKIAARTLSIYDIKCIENSAEIIGKCGRGTPRIINNIVKRIRDFMTIKNENILNRKMCLNFLEKLEIDENGLNADDRRYLRLLFEKFNGGPVGIETLSTTLGEEKENIEANIENYLVKTNLIERTPKGRILTKYGKNYIKLFYK